MTADFICQFKTNLYPFDTQKCQAKFQFTGTTRDFVRLENHGMNYTGQIQLSSYVITGYEMTINEHQVVMVDITFGRGQLNDLLSVNLPGLILVLVRK